MLPNKLPQSILQSCFEQLHVGQTRDYAGTVMLSSLTGLEGMVLNVNDEFGVELTIGKDEERYAYIEGQINGKVQVTCQRCLETMSIEIETSFCLSPILPQGKVALPPRYEPTELDDGKLEINKLISEEILLNLPMIPVHAPSACQGEKWLQKNRQQAMSLIKEDVVKSPFEVLKKVK